MVGPIAQLKVLETTHLKLKLKENKNLQYSLVSKGFLNSEIFFVNSAREAATLFFKYVTFLNEYLKKIIKVKGKIF